MLAPDLKDPRPYAGKISVVNAVANEVASPDELGTDPMARDGSDRFSPRNREEGVEPVSKH